jgi:hypothetical protein
MLDNRGLPPAILFLPTRNNGMVEYWNGESKQGNFIMVIGNNQARFKKFPLFQYSNIPSFPLRSEAELSSYVHLVIPYLKENIKVQNPPPTFLEPGGDGCELRVTSCEVKNFRVVFLPRFFKVLPRILATRNPKQVFVLFRW